LEVATGHWLGLEANDSYDVVLLGFEPREESPEARLQRVFGIEPAAAAKLVTRLPQTVQRGVSRVRAEYFRRALALLGAVVEVRDRKGRVLAVHASSDMIAAPAATVPAATVIDPLNATGPTDRPAAHRAWVDPMSQTLAITAAKTPFGSAHEPAPSKAIAPADSSLRAPAHPTLREAPTLQLDPDPARRAVAQPPTLHAMPAAVSAAWQGSAAAPLATTPRHEPQPPSEPSWGALAAPASPSPSASAAHDLPWPRDPSSVWDAPAVQGEPIKAPRDPSSVWDPPPNKPVLSPSPAQERARPAPCAQDDFAEIASLPRADAYFAQLAAAPRHAAEPAQRVAALSLEPAVAHFDLTKSVVGQALWRPVAGKSAAPMSALTLDDDPEAAARRVLSPWEQPNAESMAEPKPHEHDEHGLSDPAVLAPAALAAPRPGKRADVAAAKQAPRKAAPRAAPAGAVAAGVVGVYPRGAEESLAQADLRSFWETFGEAMILPFRGRGGYWIGAISAWSVLLGALGSLGHFSFMLGWGVTFLGSTPLLALACDYYRTCFWAPATGDKSLARGPDLDLVRAFDRYLKSGLHFSLFMLCSQLPLLYWVFRNSNEGESMLAILTDPLTWAMALPYAYWPMGVGLAALGNDPAAIWKVPAGLRAISRAPFEHTVIVLTGAVIFVTSWVALLLIGSRLGVTGAMLSGTIGLPLAVSHGVQGALMGHLVRARSEVFE
jgi:hypothetical protein